MSEAQSVVLSYEDGARAVELAREAVEGYVLDGRREQPGSMRDAFYNRTGVFVRLTSRGGRLRGCAGSHESNEQLGQQIVEAAIHAASESSCRSEIEPAELPSITVSVCIVSDVVLTDNPLDDLEVGRHGVVVDGQDAYGDIFPTVPVEQNWSAGEYLDRTSRKAGLPPGAWTEDSVVVTLYEGQVFRERNADGEIEQLSF